MSYRGMGAIKINPANAYAFARPAVVTSYASRPVPPNSPALIALKSRNFVHQQPQKKPSFFSYLFRGKSALSGYGVNTSPKRVCLTQPTAAGMPSTVVDLYGREVCWMAPYNQAPVKRPTSYTAGRSYCLYDIYNKSIYSIYGVRVCYTPGYPKTTPVVVPTQPAVTAPPVVVTPDATPVSIPATSTVIPTTPVMPVMPVVVPQPSAYVAPTTSSSFNYSSSSPDSTPTAVTAMEVAPSQDIQPVGPADDGSKKKLLIGGILAAVLIGGGVLYVATRKKKS